MVGPCGGNLPAENSDGKLHQRQSPVNPLYGIIEIVEHFASAVILDIQV